MPWAEPWSNMTFSLGISRVSGGLSVRLTQASQTWGHRLPKAQSYGAYAVFPGHQCDRTTHLRVGLQEGQPGPQQSITSPSGVPLPEGSGRVQLIHQKCISFL